MKSAYELNEEKRSKWHAMLSISILLIMILAYIMAFLYVYNQWITEYPHSYQNDGLYIVTDNTGSGFYTDKVISIPGGIRLYDVRLERFVEIYGTSYTIKEPKLNSK